MFIRINNHRINLDDISYFDGDEQSCRIVNRAGRNFNFSGEPAQALELFLSSLEKTIPPQVINLGAAFKSALAASLRPVATSVDLPPALSTPIPPKTLACPLTKLHTEMLQPCAACGHTN